MLNKKVNNELDSFETKRIQIINEISAKYDYIESMEDDRLVITNKRIKLIEVKNTQEDIKKYEDVIKGYFLFIKQNYIKDASCGNFDINSFFQNEVVEENQMPMFFVYTTNGDLIGTCGFRKSLELKVHGKSTMFHELSVRITLAKSYKNNDIAKPSFGYGAIAYLLMYLYAMNNCKRVYQKNFIDLRDMLFRGLNRFTYFDYIGVKREKSFSVLEQDFDVDVYIDNKNDVDDYKKLLDDRF